jgi:hypothetical protein
MPTTQVLIKTLNDTFQRLARLAWGEFANRFAFFSVALASREAVFAAE